MSSKPEKPSAKSSGELDVQRRIQLEVGSRLDTRLFRNNVGMLYDERGRPVPRRTGVRSGQRLTAEFGDGEAGLRAE